MQNVAEKKTASERSGWFLILDAWTVKHIASYLGNNILQGGEIVGMFQRQTDNMAVTRSVVAIRTFASTAATAIL